MTTLDWSVISKDFETDGGLRDIYVVETTIRDWQVVLDHIRAMTVATFTVDGEIAKLPGTVSEIFELRNRAATTLDFEIGGIRLACHFFWEGEIEFDFWPEDLNSESRFGSLVALVMDLGGLTRKRVIVTPENYITSPILEFDPATNAVAFIPDLDAAL